VNKNKEVPAAGQKKTIGKAERGNVDGTRDDPDPADGDSSSVTFGHEWPPQRPGVLHEEVILARNEGQKMQSSPDGLLVCGSSICQHTYIRDFRSFRPNFSTLFCHATMYLTGSHG
jgi:hypothetical protein